MLDERLQLLNALCVEIERRGISVSVDSETICIGREAWDHYSRRAMTMLSARPSITLGEKSFYIFASEQYDERRELRKYSIKLCDAKKSELFAWDLDTKRGFHKHEFTGGEKGRRHIPHSGELEDIADELMNLVRTFDPLRTKEKR